jgi:hypothetical protein
MSNMKAAVAVKFGGPEARELRDVADAAVGPRDVRSRRPSPSSSSVVTIVVHVS